MAVSVPIRDIGWEIPAFDAPSADRRPVSLADVEGPRGTSMTFIRNRNRDVPALSDGMIRDARAWQTLGIGVGAILSGAVIADREASVGDMARVDHEQTFPFSARSLDAQQNNVRTPDLRHHLLNAMKSLAETGMGLCEQTPSMTSINWKDA